jgi:hypothetical protein
VATDDARITIRAGSVLYPESAMLEFLAIAFSFPALPFTVGVVLSTVFWLISLFGFELGEEGLELADDPSGWAALASLAKVGSVPLTVWLALFSLWSWGIAFVGGWALPEANPWVDLGIGALAIVGGLVLARVSSRPLAPLFATHGAEERDRIVGEVAEITTSRVDRRFGQARIESGSDDWTVQVRCDGPNTLHRGDRALVVQFDAVRDAFVVEPLGESTITTTTTGG